MAAGFKTMRKDKFDLKGKLISQWKEDSYCDASFSVAGDIVRAHRCVLAAASEYFDVMFTANFKEKTQPVIDLSDSFKRGEELRTVFEFIYGSEIVVEEGNVEGLLQGGEIFDLPELLEHCVEFLLQNLKLPNILWSWSLAETYSLEELADVCEKIAVRRFHDSLRTMPESLKVPPTHLLKLIEAGLMKYCTADEAIKFMDLYISQDPSERKSYQQEFKALAIGETIANSSAQPDLKTSQDHNQNEKKDSVNDLQRNQQNATNPADLLGTKPKVESTSNMSKMEDCVLCTTRDGNRWCVYRSTKDVWLCAPATGNVIGKEWHMYHIGLGSNSDYAILHSPNHDHFKLLHLFTCEITSVPRVPKLGPEKRALNSDREIIWMKNCDGELHCFIGCVMRVEKKVKIVKPKSKKANSGWMDNLRGMYGEAPTERTEVRTVYGVYAYRLNLAKKHWKFVCVVSESYSEILRMEGLQQPDSSLYVVVVYEGKLDIWIYLPRERNIKHISSFTGSLPSSSVLKDVNILSSERYVMVHSTKESKVFLYDKAENKWSQQDKFRIPHVTVPGESFIARTIKTVLSQCEGMSYHLDMTMGAQNPFKSYNIFSKTMKTLKPAPLVKQLQLLHMDVKRIPTAILDKLTPATMKEQHQEKLLNIVQVNNALSEYQMRLKEERGEEDDEDWETEEDEEEDDCCPYGCCTCHQDKDADSDDELLVPPWLTPQAMMDFIEQEGVKERFVTFMRSVMGL